MKKIKYLIIQILLIPFFALDVSGQVDVTNIYVRPPYQATFEYYYNASNVSITLHNKSNEDKSIVFDGSIIGETTGISLKLSQNRGTQTPIVIKRGELKILDKADLDNIFNNSSIVIEGYNKNNFNTLTNRLPSDCYNYKLQAIDPTTGQVLGEESETQFCIASVGQVVLLEPEMNKNIEDPNVPFLFSWTRSDAKESNIEYNLEVVELSSPDQDPNQAFQTSPPLFIEKPNLSGFLTNYVYQAFDTRFEPGKSYGWRIRQTEKNGIDAGYDFANGGYSEASVFTYNMPQQNPNVDFSVQAIYPPDGEAIPFRNIPFIIKWGPYDDKYEVFNSDVIITNDISAFPIVNEKSTINQWTGLGPLKGQQAALRIARSKNVDAMTEEDAQFMPVGPKGENLKTFNLYEDHRKVRWSANIAMGTKDIVTSEGNVSGSFVAGMGKPVLSSLSKDELKTGKQINFKFKTSEPPAILFPEKMVQSAKNGQLTKFEDLAVYEKCVVEISKGKDFLPNEIVKNAIGELIEVKNKSEWTELRDYVYKDLEVKFDLEAGNYFWRVKWLVNPNETKDFSNSYSESEIQAFCVGGDCGTPPPPDPPKYADCGGCTFEISNKKAASDPAKVNDIFKIGSNKGFHVKITKIDESGNGEGILPIELLNLGSVQITNNTKLQPGQIPMKVKLEGIKLNTDGEMMAGKVKSVKKEGIGINLDIPFTTPEATMALLKNDPSGDLFKQWVKVKKEIDDMPKNVENGINSMGLTTPLGISESFLGSEITIAFDDFEFTSTSNSFSAIAIVEAKEENIIIPFGIKGTCLGIEGAGKEKPCQDYTLFLAKDVPFSNFKLKGNTDISKATHLKYSFNGPRKFQNIHIAAEYEFDEKILKPKEGNEKVKVDMIADSPNGFADWTATVSVPPFKVAGVEDFIFELVGTATYDHSLQVQPVGMKTMLEKLKESKVDAEGLAAIENMKSDTWMGFYLPKLKVQLPEIFKADQKDNVKISVEHLIIDSKHGLCGSLTAENVFGIGAGNLDGWYYSLDKIDVSFFNNSFLESSAKGKIILPISGNPTIDKNGKALGNNATNAEVTQLDYKMILSPNKDNSLKYQFKIEPKDDVNVPIWKANMKLEKSSNITVTVGDANVNNGKILVKAELNGNISFDFGKAAKDATGFPIPDFKLDLITFQGFKIQSKEPYIDLGKYDSNVLEQGSKVYDGFNNFASAFASPQKSINGFPLTIDKFEPFIKINKAGFLLAGGLEMSDIPLKPVAKVGIAILAKIDFKDGRPVFAYDGVELDSVYIAGELGPVSVKGGLKFYNNDVTFGNGFAGSLFTGFPMNISLRADAKFGRKDTYDYWYVYANATGFPPIPILGPISLTGFGGGAYHNMTGKSVTLSGNDVGNIPTSPIYTPKEGTTGIKAGINLNIIEDHVAKAQAILGVEFGTNNNVSLEGAVQVVNSNGNPEKGTGMLNGEFLATYDIDNSVFLLQGGVHANQAGITLDLPKNGLEILINRDSYHLFVGTPTNRIKLTVADLASVDAYFMIGTDIPTIPAPNVPPDVLSKLNYKPFDMGAAKTGTGIAFGASFNSTAELDLAVVSVGYQAGIGMDMNIRNGAGECGGMQAGYNGWYAQAQVYGYLQVKVSVILLGSTSIGLYARLSAGFPNPTWIDGNVYVENPIKDFSLPLQIGGKCVVKINPFNKPELINSVDITNGEKGVNVYHSPTIVMNYPLEFEVDGIDEQENTIVEAYKLEVEASYRGVTNARVSTTTTDSYTLKQQGQTLFWNKTDIFQPRKEYSIIINAKTLVKRGNETNYQVYKWKGKEITETKVIPFETGDLGPMDDKIVVGRLPFKNQKFALSGEYQKGTLSLLQATDFTLYSNDKRQFEDAPLIVLTNESTKKSVEIPTLISGSNITYSLASKLEKNTRYTVKLVMRGKKVSRSIDLSKTTINSFSNPKILQNQAVFNEAKLNSIKVQGSVGQRITDLKNANAGNL
jgi:hypothetical protein